MTRITLSRTLYAAATLATAFLVSPSTGPGAQAQVFQLNRPITVPELQPRTPIPPMRIPPEIRDSRGACPDLAVSLRQAPRADGTILITMTVRNVGTADYISGPNQQLLHVNTGGRTPRTYPFQNMRRGESRSWHEVHHPFEFPATYRVHIAFDPDIRIDGNPMNDDCNPNNNAATLTTAR
ncbi:MAG: hypothetical protein JJU19_03745 [Pararhodobacter sp.]|nr:hypothetical protein [Pararhodobacter sp.]